MADFTIRLCDLIQSGYDVEQLAMQSWPAPTDEIRSEVNKAILRHYWFKEIGFETADMFSFYLDSALNEIMPYYNQVMQYQLGDKTEEAINTYSESVSFTKNSNSTDTTNGEKTKTGTITNTKTDDYTDNETTNGSDSQTIGTTNNSSNTVVVKNMDIPIKGTGLGGFDDSYVSSGNTEVNTANSTIDETRSGTNENTKERTNKGTSKDDGSQNWTDTDNTTVNHNDNTTENTERNGFDRPQFELIELARKTIQNVTMMIVHDRAIAQCFMGLFGGLNDEWY